MCKWSQSLQWLQEELRKLGRGKRPQKTIYARLLAKAAHALAEVSLHCEVWFGCIQSFWLLFVAIIWCWTLRDKTNLSPKTCGWNPIFVLLHGDLALSNVSGNLVVNSLSLSLSLLHTHTHIASVNLLHHKWSCSHVVQFVIHYQGEIMATLWLVLMVG